ncbi:glucosamine 6-phosphate N-acetyltransferase isoform X1 [Camellia sinensis]|nr:glucosamine 6-phosphate N-acetyltransferase isoform X1 [Camellia sinensis]XP_028087710.1 glucosamine 6-phosphate N-acetyltransferase isoform X1 [Camellia sinensis]XP_028087711.1 glucosamine 6-phosphate N-acetyltransferase isoform X1 [Camellia sinensis]
MCFVVVKIIVCDDGRLLNTNQDHQNIANLKRSCEILRKRMQNNNSFHEDSFQVRKLEISDKSKGFIELLQQLTVCDSVSEKQFEERFRELSSYGDDHLICVIEDNRSGKIVATGSVFTEKKFIRNCGKVGHIEDVVVDSSARGMQLGKKIVEFLIDHARSTGCYKVILDCSTDNRVFYEKCGFKQKEIQMVKYFI